VDEVKKVLPGGIPEYEFRASIELRAREQGAEDVRVMLATPGTKGQVLHLPTVEHLQPGNWLQCYVAVAKDRYWSDMAVCLPVGAEDTALSEMNMKLKQRVIDFGAQMHPGSNLGEIAEKLYQQNNQEAPGFHLYGLGGGIGLSINERPDLRPGENRLLSTGMALSVNFLQGHQDKTCLYKATFIVTDNGCEHIDF
jgi:Xaa-Pro aminopeptidase